MKYLTNLLIVCGMLVLMGCASQPGSRLPGLNKEAVLQSSSTFGGYTEVFIRNRFKVLKSVVEKYSQSDLSFLALRFVNSQEINRIEGKRSLHFFEKLYPKTALLNKPIHPKINLDQPTNIVGKFEIATSSVLIHKANLERLLRRLVHRADALDAILIHEIMHAVDSEKHQVFDKRGTMLWRSSHTLNAIVEGYAQYHTEAICKALGCQKGFSELELELVTHDLETDTSLEEKQGFISKLTSYRYLEGKKFIAALYERDPSLVELAYESPPLDPITILVPYIFPDLERNSSIKGLQELADGLELHLEKRWTVTALQLDEVAPESFAARRNKYTNIKGSTSFVLANQREVEMPWARLFVFKLNSHSMAKASATEAADNTYFFLKGLSKTKIRYTNTHIQSVLDIPDSHSDQIGKRLFKGKIITSEKYDSIKEKSHLRTDLVLYYQDTIILVHAFDATQLIAELLNASNYIFQHL